MAKAVVEALLNINFSNMQPCWAAKPGTQGLPWAGYPGVIHSVTNPGLPRVYLWFTHGFTAKDFFSV